MMKAKAPTFGTAGSRSLWLLLPAVFTASMGYGAVLPITRYVLLRSGVPVTDSSVAVHAGLLTGAYMLAFAVLSPVWGKLADVRGRRTTILACLSGLAVTSVAFIAPTGIWAVYALRGLSGAFAAGVMPAALSYVSDTAQEVDRARAMGRVTAGSTLGFLAGPALSGWLAGASTALFRMSQSAQVVIVPFAGIAALTFATLVACYLFLPESLHGSTSGELVRETPIDAAEGRQREGSVRLGRLLALAALGAFALGGFEVGSALRVQQVFGFGPREISLVFVECGLVMMVVQAGVVGPSVVRVGPRRVVILALVITALGFVALPFVSRYAAFALAGGIVAAGTGLLVPVVAFWAASGAGRLTGTTLGWQSAAAGAGQAIGSSLFGLSLGGSDSLPYLLTAALLIMGVALCPPAPRHARGIPQSGEEPVTPMPDER